MAIEIDQSWRVEYTNKPTVIADSKGNSVILSAKDKKYLQKIFRKAGKTRVFVYQTFSCLVALIISKSKTKEGQTYVIDIEYPGWDDQIRDYVLLSLRKLGIIISADQITFSLIGKRSAAHNTAYRVFKRLAEPKAVVQLKEILRLLVGE